MITRLDEIVAAAVARGKKRLAVAYGQLMTCRFCIRHAWGQCKKGNTNNRQEPFTNEQWKDPLFLALADGRRFRLQFNCNKCEMSVVADDKDTKFKSQRQ